MMDLLKMQLNDNCPIPLSGSHGLVTLAHGEGGLLSRELIRDHMQVILSNPTLNASGDAACLNLKNSSIMMTTDSYVVSPLFFPGGNIGSLAVYGTVNDLLVSGAIPYCISLGIIIEEGFPITTLDRILESVRIACENCGVFVSTGDTKVVPRGQCDQIYLHTTGVGKAGPVVPPGPQAIQPGDEILVTGPIGQHGIAILSARENLQFEPEPTSDVKSLANEINAIRDQMEQVRSLRDATRGGVSAVLHEWAEAAQCTFTIMENQLPISPEVQAVCELLGLNPLHIACEGTMVIATASGQGPLLLESLHASGNRDAAIIGTARSRQSAPVTIKYLFDRELPIDEPMGAPLPRIC